MCETEALAHANEQKTHIGTIEETQRCLDRLSSGHRGPEFSALHTRTLALYSHHHEASDTNIKHRDPPSGPRNTISLVINKLHPSQTRPLLHLHRPFHLRRHALYRVEQSFNMVLQLQSLAGAIFIPHTMEHRVRADGPFRL